MDGTFRGPLELLLLTAVKTCQPVHGYGIVEELHRIGGPAIDVPEGGVYPALHALEASGLVKSRWSRKGDRRRRLYELSPNGRAELALQRRALANVSAAVGSGTEEKPWATPTI